MTETVFDLTRTQALAEDWIAAWSERDLDRIMAHYANDVVFTSQTVVTRYGQASGNLNGIGSLRAHFQMGLETFGSQVHFTLIDVLSGVNGYTIYYKRENDVKVTDTMLLNDVGKVVRVYAHYRPAD